ncbi:MAG: UDP-N-acetylmuramoyl-L-alanyl-D-glutamate--2,6-diaminopimelate ligase [Planctomycetes bacterium]|nr:UDP-N-acetylmuramoyl-L-alanyl-D-glutamate--2,6-diaminopimelate ligase [Planctomycetota bacterium]
MKNPKTNPNKISLGELAADLAVEQRAAWKNVVIDGLTDDSRTIQPGNLFIAVNGEQTDGHEYIPDALRRGASALVVEEPPADPTEVPILQVPDTRFALSALASRFYGNPAHKIHMVGVTGTDGKTTTTALIRAILEQSGHKTGTLGTLEYRLGDNVLPADQTTPHPLALHSMLAEARAAGVTHMVMEVSSHALVHQRTAHIPFDVAVLTNVTEDHLDFHGSKEAYIQAKQVLFEQLPAESVAVLNADSPVAERYQKATNGNALTYGRETLADFQLLDTRASVNGMKMLVRTPLNALKLGTKLVGDYNCENILAAMTAGFLLGVPAEAVQMAVANFPGVGGRLEKIAAEGEPVVVVDYAHTPNALGKVLQTLRPLTDGRLICVFGCGGDRETQKRPLMGNIATKLSDYTIVTADNSRSEKTEDIIDDILTGVQSSAEEYTAEPDRRKAIQQAINMAGNNDLIALCGRGCEQHQILGDRQIPFDDRDVTRDILEEKTRRKRKSA